MACSALFVVVLAAFIASIHCVSLYGFAQPYRDDSYVLVEVDYTYGNSTYVATEATIPILSTVDTNTDTFYVLCYSSVYTQSPSLVSYSRSNGTVSRSEVDIDVAARFQAIFYVGQSLYFIAIIEGKLELGTINSASGQLNQLFSFPNDVYGGDSTFFDLQSGFLYANTYNGTVHTLMTIKLLPTVTLISQCELGSQQSIYYMGATIEAFYAIVEQLGDSENSFVFGAMNPTTCAFKPIANLPLTNNRWYSSQIAVNEYTMIYETCYVDYDYPVNCALAAVDIVTGSLLGNTTIQGRIAKHGINSFKFW